MSDARQAGRIRDFMARVLSRIKAPASIGFGQGVMFLAYNALFNLGILGINDVVLNFYFVSLGYDRQAIGLLQSIPRIGGLLTSVPIAFLTNRIGARRMMLIATVGLALAFLLMLIDPSPAMMIISRFLTGFFYGAQQIALVPLMVVMVERRHQSRFFAVHNLVSTAAMSLGSLLGGWLPALVVTVLHGLVPAAWVVNAQTPFAYGAAVAIASLLALLSILPFLYVRTDSAIQPRRARGEPRVRRKTPWKLVFLLTFPMIPFGFTGGLTFPFYNLFFRTRFNLPDETVGTILAIGWIGMAVLPMLGPALERRVGRAWALAIVMGLAGAAFVALGSSFLLLPAGIAFFFAIAFRNMMNPIFHPMLMDHLPPDLHNIASSMIQVLWSVGWFSATAISGVWQETYGFTFIMQVVAVGVLVVGAAAVMIYRKREILRVRPEAALP
jgi:predicted MFS family arabinose efflux permease